MHVSDQGIRSGAEPVQKQRYRTVPRSLIFVTSVNPATGAEEVLLLKGAPHKRLWANRYNGLGGHIEGHEDVLAGAERELHEEAGLSVQTLTLRGVVNVYTGPASEGDQGAPGVMLFVFHARTDRRQVRAGAEGALEWIPVADLADYPLVDDLYQLIPRVLAPGPLVYAHYTPRPDGSLAYRFR